MFAAFHIAACLLAPAAPPGGEAEHTISELIRVFRHPDARGERFAQSVKAMADLEAIGTPAIPQLLRSILNGSVAGEFCDAVLQELPYSDVSAAVAERWKIAGAAERWKYERFYGRYDYERMATFAIASIDDRQATIRDAAWAFIIRNAKSKSLAPARARYLTALAGGGEYGYRWELLFTEPVFDAEREADILIGLLKRESWVAKGTVRVPLSCSEPPEWPDGRSIVVAILGHRGVKRAVPALLALLKEKGTGRGHFGEDVIPVLGDLGDASVIAELKSIAGAKPEESSLRMKALAARSLLQLGDGSGVQKQKRD